MKSLKTVAMMIVVCVMIAGTASADDPALYYSLHDPSQLYYYCSKDSGLGGILQLPCFSPYPYYNQQFYTAIKDRLNPDDMKVMCHLNPADATTCGSMTQITFDFGGSVTPSSITSKFRLFVPPGTVNVTVQYYVARDAQMAVLSRFGQLPTGEMANYPVTTIKAAPFTVSDYWSAEHPVMNTDGLITPISTDYPNNDFLQSLSTTAGNNTGGGWLYMKLLPYTNANIQLIKFTLTVKLDIFRAWYTKVNAISGYWDAMGNPPPISSQGTPCTSFPTASITTTYNGATQINSPLSIKTSESVTFTDNTGSSSRTWSMVNITGGTEQSVPLSSPTSQSFSYSFTTAGIYKVSLVVKDANGCSSQSPASVTVTVSPPPCTSFPTASITTTYNGATQVNSPLSIPPPGGSVTFADNTGSSSRTWSMVNITGGTEQPVSLSSPTAQSFSYSFSTAGTYKVSLVVTNANGCSSQQAATVTVTVASCTQTQYYTVNGSANPTAGGIVIPTSQTVTQGGIATIIAIPNSGHKFAGWTGTGCVSNATVPTVATVSSFSTSAMTCTASFTALTQYTIVPGSNGTVSRTSAYPDDSVSAMPNSRYRFVNWTWGTSNTSNDNPLKILSSMLTPITANFEPVLIFSTKSSSTEGSITPGSDGKSATATPAAGYSVKWTDQYGNDVSDLTNGNTITIPSPTGNAAYVANFYKTPHTMTLSVGKANDSTPLGTFYVDGKALELTLTGDIYKVKSPLEVPDNGTVVITVIPKDGKQFSNWTKTGDSTYSSTANPLVLANVTSDTEFKPIFGDVSANHYTVNFIAGPGGNISGVASQTVLNNSYFNTIIAVANCGYKFSYWKEEPADGTTPANLLNLPELELVVNKNKTYTAVFVPFVNANTDGKLGLEEVIYILQVLSGVRP